MAYLEPQETKQVSVYNNYKEQNKSGLKTLKVQSTSI